MNARTLQDVLLSKIVCEDQPRLHFDDAGLQELKTSIQVHGVFQPVLVRPNRDDPDSYVLIAGHRRCLAAKLAGLTTVPAIVETRDLTPAEIVEIQLIENMQRVDLKHTEKARAISDWIASANITAGQAAAKLGIAAGTVTKLLALLCVSEAIQKAVDANTLPLTAAYELSRLKDDAERASLAEQLLNGSVNRDTVTAIVRSHTRKTNAASSATASRAIALLGNGRSVTVCAEGLTLQSLIETLEELLSKARKARPQGLELGTFLKMLKDQAKA